MIRVIRNNSSGKRQPYMGGTGHVRCRENDEHWNRYRKEPTQASGDVHNFC